MFPRNGLAAIDPGDLVAGAIASQVAKRLSADDRGEGL